MPVPHHSVFLQAGCPPCRPTNSVKAPKALALKALIYNHYNVTEINMTTRNNKKRPSDINKTGNRYINQPITLHHSQQKHSNRNTQYKEQYANAFSFV